MSIDPSQVFVEQAAAMGHWTKKYGGRPIFLPGKCAHTVMELIAVSDADRQLFETVQAAAENWDGSEPIRRLD